MGRTLGLGFAALVLLAAAAVTLTAWLRKSRRLRRLRRRLARGHVVTVRDAQPGPVQLEGRARFGDKRVRSPLTGDELCGYRIAIYSATKHEPLLRCEEARFEDFVLQDDSGRILVQASDVELLTYIEGPRYALWRDVAPGIREIVERLLPDHGLTDGRQVTWSLHTLAEGDEVFVDGELRRVAGAGSASGGYRDAAQLRYVTAAPQHSLIVADSKEVLLMTLSVLSDLPHARSATTRDTPPQHDVV